MSRYKLGNLTVRDWNSWDRVPRDPATIGYMIVNGVGYAAAGTAVAATAGLAAFGYMAVGYIATTLVPPHSSLHLHLSLTSVLLRVVVDC